MNELDFLNEIKEKYLTSNIAKNISEIISKI